jgi:uncharacterized protein YigE (DUF2233 family)
MIAEGIVFVSDAATDAKWVSAESMQKSVADAACERLRAAGHTATVASVHGQGAWIYLDWKNP